MAQKEGGTYKQTVVTPAGKPSTSSMFDLKVQAPLIRELVSSNLVEEPKLQQELDSARSFFTGHSIIDDRALLSNLKFGQEIKLNIKKDQNPLGLFQKTAIEYEAVDSCHDQIQLDCTVPCLNTLPKFENFTFRFDTEYAYGVRACDKNTDFWDFKFFTEQYALSKRAEQFGRELDLWNTVIKALIAAPATTVDVTMAHAHATHYWANQGKVAANGRALITEANFYLLNNFADINPTVFMTAEAATELVKSVENPYNLNQAQTRVNTFEDWNVPGFMISSAVKEILGTVRNVVIMKRSPWLTTGTHGSFVSQYPLYNANATKQYVAILDPRVGYQFAKEGYHLVITPYDCDHLVRGMIDTEYVGSGVTFPVYGLIIEFDAYEYAPAAAAAAALKSK